MKKAVAYMRYSSDNQNETSIEYQRFAIMNYCITNSITLVEEYIDEAYSATTDRRPDFQRMMRDAQNHPEWGMVLVHDLSRFCRNASDASRYKNLLNDHDIHLVSVTQNFGETNEAFLMEGITNLMNEAYSRDNAKATHAGMMVKANKAGHCGGQPALGYDLDATGNLIINEEEAEIVRKIFNMFELEYSYSRMAQVLNDEGYTTKSGKPFDKHSFSSILTREKYTGTFIWNQTRQKNSKARRNSHQKKPIEKQVRIDNGCPQIITREQFQRVQKALAARAYGKAASKRRHHYMLSGLKVMKCAECGSFMIGTSRSSHGKKYTTYTCPNHKGKGCPTKEIRTEYVDKLVARLIYQDLLHRDDHKAISAQMKHSSATKKLQDKKRGVERAIGSVIKAIETSCSETLVKRLNQLETEKASLTREIAKSIASNTGITSDMKTQLFKKFARHLMKSDDPDVKQFLTETISSITVSNESVSVEMKIA